MHEREGALYPQPGHLGRVGVLLLEEIVRGRPRSVWSRCARAGARCSAF